MLRAKIDMASGNINLRDPVLYRILHATHPRTGDAWCVYPTYDFAHGQSDAIEGVTHSLCTLEFEDHRPLYDWFLENLSVPSRPRQIEFARLNLSHTVLSKRFLLRLVSEGRVRGWDDPRMPTISGIRRRGFPAAPFAFDGAQRTRCGAVLRTGALARHAPFCNVVPPGQTQRFERTTPPAHAICGVVTRLGGASLGVTTGGGSTAIRLQR